MTSLVKKLSGIGLKTGGELICHLDQTATRKILSEGLYEAVSLYNTETKPEQIKVMVADLMEDYSYDPAMVIVDVIKDIRKGKRKIYGRVTPNDLREMITEKLEQVAIERERRHQEAKGYSDFDLSERSSGRFSDLFKKVVRFNDKK